MAELFKIFSTFSYGEASPKMYSRINYEGYDKSAKRIRNFLVIPQGGVRRRFGTRFLASLIGLSDYTEAHIECFTYNDEDNYLLIFTPLLLYIYHETNLVTSIATSYTASDIPNIRTGQTNNEMIIVDGAHQPQLLTRDVAHSTWSIAAIDFKVYPVADFDKNYFALTFTPSAVSGTINLTISGGTGIFAAKHVGGIFYGNGGTARIISITSATVAVAQTITDFIDTSSTLGKYCFLGEVAWSSTHGWPKTIGFYQNRLFLGGTSSLPTFVWGSETNDYFNFNQFDISAAASAITFRIQGKYSNIIKHILGARTLLVFTTDGIYSTPVLQTDPLTNENGSLTLQEPKSCNEVSPEAFDNAVIFVAKGGKIVHSFNYDIERGSYRADDISVFSDHLIRNPVRGAIYENSEIDDGVYYFLVNSDGTVAAFQSMQAENIHAWSLQDTSSLDGKIRDIASITDDLYFLVEREVNGNTVFYVEQLSFDLLTDCSKTYSFATATDTLTGLAHLEGEEVQILGSNDEDLKFVLNTATVTSGAVTASDSFKYFEVGLDFSDRLDLTLLPINNDLETGPDLFFAKHINTAYVSYVNSAALTINGMNIPGLEFPYTFSTDPSPLNTGYSRMTLMEGYLPTAEITISQSKAVPCLVSAVGLKIMLR